MHALEFLRLPHSSLFFSSHFLSFTHTRTQIAHIPTPQECDDNNLVNGDGCSDTCRVEPGFDCNTTATSAPDLRCSPILGDGMRVFVSDLGRARNKSEECDDGNLIG